MFLHPLTQPLGYSTPDGKGVYVLPFSEKAPSGWGDPRMVDGKAVVPGTPGGANPVALIYRRSGAFKRTASKYFQKAGNITWWGQYRRSAYPARGRHVLSYFGPKLRYFKEEGFTYGDSDTHNDVYYMGNYAAVAPGPVAGACLRKMPFRDPVTNKTKDEVFLIVAVARANKDEFYRKRWNYKVIPSRKMTDTVRSAEKRMYEAKAVPEGWQKMGEYAKPSDDHFKTETPWFFNESGTEAVAMRRRRTTFNNGHEDVTEDAFDRLKATVTPESVSVQNLGNDPPMDYSEKVKKEHPTHTSTDHAGFTHEWQEDHVSVEVTLKGAQYILGDYRGDTLYWGKIKYDITRGQKGYYTEGIDEDPYIVTYLGAPKNISNRGLRLGPYYHNIYEYNYTDPDYVPAQGDHELTWWSLIREKIDLVYGPESNVEENLTALHLYENGTSDEWVDQPFRDENSALFFYDFTTRYFRGFFDIRKQAGFVYERRIYGLYQTTASPTLVSRTEQHKDGLFTKDNSQAEPYRSVNKSTTHFSVQRWPVALMDEWPDEIDATLGRTTYEGAWPKDNHEAVVQVPGNKTFYLLDETGDYTKSWPTIPDLLYGKDNVCKGNGVRTERDEICFSVEVPDVENEGKYVVLSDHKTGGKLTAIVGYGEKFYPVGAC